ncbi:FimD/PapC N-terminal domain-containing protein, partial [Providencia rettgeri]|nr:fimbrial biogenesis outer membrane usher protein [Providencia rettgeri]
KYDVMVNVNLIPSGEFNIAFDKQPDGQIIPVFTVGELKKLGVNTSALPKLRDLGEEVKIAKLSDYIADATITFDAQTLTVNLSVPQIAMVPNFAGYIPPELRDDGVTALVMDYVFNYSNNRQLAQHNQKSSTNDSLFANLNAGINVGAWRLRTSYLYNYSKSSGDSSNSDSNFTNT